MCKTGSKLECSNYRPISLLSNTDQILERLMFNTLYNFLEKKKEIKFSPQIVKITMLVELPLH